MPQATDLTVSLPFGLRRKPFQPTADPDVFFSGGQFGDMLDRIVTTLRTRRGVCVLTGEPGTGKTTLLRRALDELATTSPLVPICGNAPLDLDELISLLGVTRSAPTGTREERLEEVGKRLRELADGGRPVALAIDDAQALDEEMLRSLISLLGRASAPDALAPLVLVGQPPLESRLEAWTARGLEIDVRCSLDPLPFAEVGSYIAHRSRHAGREAAELFSSGAVERIASLSGGVPRFVNLLCREALATAGREGARRVETNVVDAVAENLGFAAFAPRPRSLGAGRVASLRAISPRHVAWAGMGVVAVAVLFLLPWLPRTTRPVPPAPKTVPPVVARSDMPSRATESSVEVDEPPAIEPGVAPGAAAEVPAAGPRVAAPRPPSRRPETRDVTRPPARPGSTTRDGRTARTARDVPPPTLPAPIERGQGQVLLLRVENGDAAGVLALLAAGESPDVADRSGLTPLMLAVIRGDTVIGGALLQRGASVNARNHAGQTALMLAAINNNRAGTKMLLDRGANVNARTTDGWTALMYAAWRGHADIARLLLAHGADASVSDRAGWTAQRYAAWRVSQPVPAPSEGIVTGIDNVEASLPAGSGHSEVLNLLTDSRRRR